MIELAYKGQCERVLALGAGAGCARCSEGLALLVASLEGWGGAAACSVGVGVPVQLGGYVAWLHKVGGAVWALWALEPGSGERALTDLKALRERVNSSWIVPWRIGAATRKAAKREERRYQVGDRLGATRLGTREGVLGLAIRVDSAGKLLDVQLEPNGAALPVSATGLDWFVWDKSRWLAWDWFWQRGRTVFAHYRNMLGVMAGKQRTLEKTPNA